MIFENFSMCGFGSKRSHSKFQESMFRIVHEGLVIRVWRAEKELKDFYNSEDIARVVSRCINYSSIDIIKAICKLPNITAVEVLDSETANGIVYYNDW
jgi:hypothetical protein